MSQKHTPTVLKILKGNPGKRPLNKHEPKPTYDLTVAPGWMNDGQRAGWDYAIAHAPKGLLKSLDQSVLTAWVVAESLHREATERVALEGQLMASPSGFLMQHPSMAVINKQAAIMMKAASELGFSPTSRARISIEPPKDDTNPFDEF